MKKINRSAIKVMLFSYLAISKMLYYINLIFAGYEDVWRVVL